MMNRNRPGLPPLVTLTALALAASACERPSPRQPDPSQGATETQGPAPGVAVESPPGPAPETPKSILRPDVLPEAGETQAPTIEPVQVVIPFGTSGLKLDTAGQAIIDEALEKPAAKLEGPIILRGHTDSRGADGDNRVASRIRAEHVRDYLISKGIDKSRISIVALGETRPLEPNAHKDGTDNPEGRAANRRVGLEIDLPAPPPDQQPKPADAPS